MKRIFSLAVLVIGVISISARSAKSENNVAPSSPTPSAAATANPTAKESPRRLSLAKEKEALQLLGHATAMSSSSIDSVSDFSCLRAAIERDREFSGKSIADGLLKGVKKAAENDKCPQAPSTLYASKNPDIGQVQKILGEEDATETEVIDDPRPNGKYTPGSKLAVTWYKYGWLHFGVSSDGKVLAVRADRKKMLAEE